LPNQQYRFILAQKVIFYLFYTNMTWINTFLASYWW